VSLNDLDIAFHIGLPKTGTTFVQQRIFPRWPGLSYLHFRNIEYFMRLQPGTHYLVSCEGLSGAMFADKAERLEAIRRLGEMFPRAKVILSLRAHGGYISSLYSQYLRYGGTGEFDDFFSLGGDHESLMKPGDMSFGDLIDHIRDTFREAPFVYTQDDLRNQLNETLHDLADFLGVAPPQSVTGQGGPINPGLTRGGGRILRTVNQMTGCAFAHSGRDRPYKKLARWRLDPPSICIRYLNWIDAKPLVDKEKRNEIDSYYKGDWAKVLTSRRSFCSKRNDLSSDLAIAS